MDINLPVYPIPRSFATSSDNSTAISTNLGVEWPMRVIQKVPNSLRLSPLRSPLPPLLIAGSKEERQNLKDPTFPPLLRTIPPTESTENKLDNSLSDNGLKVSKAESNHSKAVVMRQTGDSPSVPPPQVNEVKNEQVDTLKTNENRFTCGSPFAPLLDLKRDVRLELTDAPERESEKKRVHRKQQLSPAGSATALLVPVTQLPSGVIAPLRDMRELQTQAVSQLKEHIPNTNQNQNLLLHPQFVAAASHQQQYTRVSIPLYYTHPIAHEASVSEACLGGAPLVRHSSQRAFGEPQQNQGDHHMFMAHHLSPRRAPFDSVIQTNAQALLQAQQQQEVQLARHAPAPRSQPSHSQPYYPVLIQATREQLQHRTDLQPLLVTRHTSKSHTPELVSHHVVPVTTRHSCEGLLSPNPSQYVQLQQLVLPTREGHSRVPTRQPSIELAVSSSASQTHVVYCHQPVALLPPEPQQIPQLPQLSQLDTANPYNVIRQQVDPANILEGDARSGRSRSHTRSAQRTSASSMSAVASMPSSRQSHRRRGNSTDDSGPPSVPAFIAIALGVCATLCCFWICGLPALLLGCMALSSKRRSQANSLSTIGAILGVLGMVCGCAAVLLICSLSLVAQENLQSGSGLFFTGWDFSSKPPKLGIGSKSKSNVGGGEGKLAFSAPQRSGHENESVWERKSQGAVARSKRSINLQSHDGALETLDSPCNRSRNDHGCQFFQ